MGGCIMLLSSSQEEKHLHTWYWRLSHSEHNDEQNIYILTRNQIPSIQPQSRFTDNAIMYHTHKFHQSKDLYNNKHPAGIQMKVPWMVNTFIIICNYKEDKVIISDALIISNYIG
jgi:hypothetical protein